MSLITSSDLWRSILDFIKFFSIIATMFNIDCSVLISAELIHLPCSASEEATLRRHRNIYIIIMPLSCGRFFFGRSIWKTSMSVLLIVRPKCTLAASHAVPWRVTLSMPAGPTDRRTNGLPDRYSTLSAWRCRSNKIPELDAICQFAVIWRTK